MSCSDGSSNVQEQLPTGDNLGTITINGMSDILYDMSVFSHLKANVGTNTEAIGLQKISSRSSSRGLDSYLDSFTDSIIVKMDSGSEAEPIQFEVVSNTNEDGSQIIGFDGKKLNNGDIITQGIIPSKVDKLYVAGDFTFVSYLTVDAMKLMNSVNAQEQRDGNGVYYQGNEQFNYNNSGNNGGRYENIWWSFYPNNTNNYGDRCFYVNYNSNYWWNDSDGSYHENRISTNENLYMRDFSEKRPAFNENEGVLMYDVNGYYSSDFRKSYIIDNTTGLIYELPRDLELSIHRGVAIDRTLGPIELIPQEDGSLKLEQMISNSKVGIGDVFKDKYGQVYIYNNSISAQEGNVICFTNRGEYVPTEDGRVIHISYGNTPQGYTCNITSVSIMCENFSESPVGKDETITINYNPYYYDYWKSFPESLRLYNEKSGSDNNFYSNTNTSFQSSHMILEIKNGYLYTMYNDWENTFGCLDLETMDYMIYQSYRGNNNANYSTYLDDGNILIAKKGAANSLYSISWLPLESALHSNVYIIKSDGNVLWLGSSDYDSYKLKYMDPVASSIENNQLFMEKYPYYRTDYKNDIEGYRTDYRGDYDYVFYRKKTIGSSFGLNDELDKISDGYDQSNDVEYRKNDKRITKQDYEYVWYTEEVKESFGYNKEYADQGYEQTPISYTEHKKVYYYAPVRNLDGAIPYSGYAYYSSNGDFLGALSSLDDNYYSGTSYHEQYSEWVHFPNGIEINDYKYKWTKKTEVARTFGFDPTMANNDYKYYTTGNKTFGVPEYLCDYIYTYYTKDVLVERFGSSRDYDWGEDVIGERIQDNYRWDYCTYKVKGNYNIYTYYDYKEGYDEETIRNMFNVKDNLESTEVVSGIYVDDGTFRFKRGVNIDLQKNTASSVTSYRIVKTDTGYEAVESGTVESSKSPIVLQPINRK